MRQDGPKRPQHALKKLQDAPKTLQETPKTPQEAPKRLREASGTLPGASPGGRIWAQNVGGLSKISIFAFTRRNLFPDRPRLPHEP